MGQDRTQTRGISPDPTASADQEGHTELQQTKKDFLSGMSHALKTPLNAILGFSELGERATDDPTLAMYFGNIRSAGTRLLDMLTDLLDFSRAQRGDYMPAISWFSLPEFLQELTIVSASEAEKKGILVREIGDNTAWCIEGDPTILRRVLQRLVTNSIQFSPPDSTIEIKVDVDVDDVGNRGVVGLRVVDQGGGVPASIHDRLFEGLEPGEHGQAKGPGLGLALARVLLELVDGQIALESTSENGSTFRVSVPVGLRPLESKALDSIRNEEEQPFQLNGRVILVADDTEPNRIMIGEMLANTGAALLEAGDGEAAVRMADQHDIDVALLDIEMPIMDGWDAAEQLRERYASSIPLVAISGHRLSADPRSERFDALLEKPLNRTSLISTLRRVLPASSKQAASSRSATDFNADDGQDPNIDEAGRSALLTLLKNALSEVEGLRANQSITLVEAFGKRMVESAERLDYDPLRAWASRLAQEASMFDIDSMNTTLARFESFIQTLESRDD